MAAAATRRATTEQPAARRAHQRPPRGIPVRTGQGGHGLLGPQLLGLDIEPPQLVIRGRFRIGTKEGLNSEDFGLELKINGDLRLSNCDLVKK